MIVMGMPMPMPNSDNSVDELPAPFMNMEPTTASTTTTVATTSDLITMMVTQNREKPSLAQCLWAFFRCQNSTSECIKHGMNVWMNQWEQPIPNQYTLLDQCKIL